MDVQGSLKDAFTEVIRFTQTGERIFSAMKDTRDVVNRLTEAAEGDPEIEPELEAAGAHLLLASQAMERAFKFSTARLEVRLKQIADDL